MNDKEAKTSWLGTRDEEEAYDLFLRELVGGEQIDGLHVAKVDVVPQHVEVNDLTDVLLLLVARQVLVLGKLLSYVGHLLVYALLFALPPFACTPILNIPILLLLV